MKSATTKGQASRNNPNTNYALYERDREDKRTAQASEPQGERTQLSNPRTAQGRPLRCPDCGAYAHAQDTKCNAELSARNSTPNPAQASEPQAAHTPGLDRTWWTYWQYNAEIDRLQATLAETKAQRDELLAACKALLQLHYDTGTASAEGLDVVHQARAAIARAEGEGKKILLTASKA